MVLPVRIELTTSVSPSKSRQVSIDSYM